MSKIMEKDERLQAVHKKFPKYNIAIVMLGHVMEIHDLGDRIDYVFVDFYRFHRIVIAGILFEDRACHESI